MISFLYATAYLLMTCIVLSTHAAKKIPTIPSFLFMLGDDIGWADFRYNNGTAYTPNVDKWAKSDGVILMQDFHTAGTVCSPTRASVLTGRTPWRDCVNGVYGCSDMTECVPKMNFAPRRTFTIADAARAAGPEYSSIFMGKWHLGSFYNDSEKHGGITSSPITHGFDHMNATVEVAPTATTNCQCRLDWNQTCLFGHYHGSSHCSGGPNPGGGGLPNGCCFNYWWEDSTKPHGVSNLTNEVGPDDSLYLADSFIRFIEGRKGDPFLAQISFHNCHVPFIGTPAARAACASNKTCKPPLAGKQPYNEKELDYYACLTELDNAIGTILEALKREGYYDTTMIWFTTDNGPERDCRPEGLCGGTEYRPSEGPGTAGPLRGRKRDMWEGGHRVPGIISYPPLITGNRISWDTVGTMDFLPTVMDVLGVKRPAAQSGWALDGLSIMPILRGETWPERGIGWMYQSTTLSKANGIGYRLGRWKYVRGSVSCTKEDCHQDQLYDLDADIGERNNLADVHPEILASIISNFTVWHKSVLNSIQNESVCSQKPPTPGPPTPPPTPAPPSPPPTPSPPPSSNCTWYNNTGLSGNDFRRVTVLSKEGCCGQCRGSPKCKAADFNDSEGKNTCHLKASFSPVSGRNGSIACLPK